jgi:hypothetical protein
VRARSQWTPGSIVLWLIAAVIATFIVCSQIPASQERPSGAGDAELEVEIVD